MYIAVTQDMSVTKHFYNEIKAEFENSYESLTNEEDQLMSKVINIHII